VVMVEENTEARLDVKKKYTINGKDKVRILILS